MRDSPGAKMATISQLSTKSESRIATKRRPPHGIIGGLCGALSMRGSPGLGPRGGRGATGGRASSAMTLDRSRTLAAGAVALGFLALPGAASATTYCTGGYNLGRPCDVTLPALQPALDAASLHPGADVVRLGFGDFTSPGFVYNDRGSAANGLTIEGTIYCEPHTVCGASILKGAGSGARQLSFVGGGGAPVTVSRLQVEVGTGAVGIELPAAARATGLEVRVTGDGAIGVRLAGAGAMLDHSIVTVTHPGGPTDVAVEATAAS